jgi:hypothetical protein
MPRAEPRVQPPRRPERVMGAPHPAPAARRPAPAAPHPEKRP